MIRWPNKKSLIIRNSYHYRFSYETSKAAVSSKVISNFRRALPQFLAVGVKNFLLFGYGMTLGFPTIVIPAIQGGEGREPGQHRDIILNNDEISWFSKSSNPIVHFIFTTKFLIRLH